MSARARLLTGALTTAVFLGVGAMRLVEGDTTWGYGLIGLGVVRGLFLAVQARQ